jgi:hypothetical protein
MEPDRNAGCDVGRSRRLADTSRQRVSETKRRLEATQGRLDRARNVLQAVWLRRALRSRRRPRG